MPTKIKHITMRPFALINLSAFLLIGMLLAPFSMAQNSAAEPINLGDFTFHGYARAGISDTQRGGQAGCYGSAADGHYVGRLGDECDTYIELALGKQGTDDEHRHWEINSMLSILTNPGAQYNDYQSVTDPGLYTSDGDIALRQMNVIGKGYLPFASEASIWGGKRYYKRRHDELLDLYYLNDSGYGGGIEDIRTKLGNLSVAWITGAQPSYTGKTNAEGYQQVQINRWDIRLNEIHLTEKASLSLSALLFNGTLNKIQSDAREPSAGGLLATAEITLHPKGGNHVLVGQFGQHSAANDAYLNQSGAAKDPLYATWQGNLRHSGRFIAYGKQNILGDHADIGYSVLFTRGLAIGSLSVPKTTPYIFSAVLSPAWHEGKYFSTHFEAGIEKYQKTSQAVEHGLQKIVLAQEFRPIHQYDALIRAYVGSYFGKDAKENLVADPRGDSSNMRAGIQISTTW